MLSYQFTFYEINAVRLNIIHKTGRKGNCSNIHAGRPMDGGKGAIRSWGHSPKTVNPLDPTETIWPLLAKRMQFDSRLLDLQFFAPSNQPIRELRPLLTNQILDPLDLSTLKSANHRAWTIVNQSDSASPGSLDIKGSGSNPNLSNCQIASLWF